jgi:hypothetical protein
MPNSVTEVLTTSSNHPTCATTPAKARPTGFQGCCASCRAIEAVALKSAKRATELQVQTQTSTGAAPSFA